MEESIKIGRRERYAQPRMEIACSLIIEQISTINFDNLDNRLQFKHALDRDFLAKIIHEAIKNDNPSINAPFLILTPEILLPL